MKFMKKKIVIKFLCLILAAVFICGSASGCSYKSEPHITSDVSSIPAMQKDVSITFSATNAKFNKKISADDITLSGAFEGMTAEVESVGRRKLQLLLKGNIKHNENYNAYDNGSIVFNAGCFSNKDLSLDASIGIECPSISLDNSSVKLENGTLSAKIKTSGYILSSDLSVNDIVIQGATVTSASLKDDGIIEFSVNTHADTLDDALAEINQKSITLKGRALGTDDDLCIYTSFIPASFYYSAITTEELDDGSVRLILELTATDGSFIAGFGKTNVILDGDIADAVLESVEVTAGVATVSIFISNLEVEKYESYVSTLIKLNENSLINEWGTTVTEPSYYYMNITLLPLTKSADATYTAMRDFCNYVGSSNLTKAIGPLAPLAYLVTGLVSTSYDICKLCGFVNEGPSEFDIICQKFDAMEEHLSRQDAKLEEILKQLERMEINDLRKEVNKVTVQMTTLESYTKSVSSYITSAATDFMSNVKVPEQSLSEISEKLVNARTENITDEQLYNMLSDDEKQALKDWNEYLNILFTSLENKASSTSLRGNNYAGYFDMVQKLKDQFMNVCNNLKATETTVFSNFDQLCLSTHIFDLTALPEREVYRASAQATIDCAMTILMQVYGELDFESLKKNVTIQDLYTNYYVPAANVISESKVERTINVPGFEDRVYFYPAVGTGEQTGLTFAPLKYEYDADEAASSAEKREEIKKQAESYYNNIRRCIFRDNISDKTYTELKNRMSCLGYNVSDNDPYKNMVYEANTMAQVLGYPISVDGAALHAYYVQSFSGVSCEWEFDKTLIVTLLDCKMYDMITGEFVEHKSYTYRQTSIDVGFGLYALYFSSSKNK